jgi:single-strand DNA-binding protein
MCSERAPNLNHVVLVGQLTQDPEMRQMPDGRSVCNLRIAVNDRTDQPALFIDIATFGATADACATHLTKGRQVAVTGRLIQKEWETKTGEKRTKPQVIGHVQFGSGGGQAAAAESEATDA